MAATIVTLLLEEIEERENIYKPIQDRIDPFKFADTTFQKRFRVNKELAVYLIENLKGELHSERIPPFVTVLTALRFFATGSDQTCIADDVCLHISQQSVSRAVQSVTEAMIKVLLPATIKFPDLEEQQRIKLRFYEKHTLPGVIGAIDGTHIPIIKPKNTATIKDKNYMNRKGYYSLNVQLMADDQLRIRSINSRYPGSVHDSFIWKNSALRHHIKNLFDEHSSNTWLLGDSGYPLEPWLLTPFTEPNEGTIQDHFNSCHIAARNCVERCFGVLKARFRCLSKHRILNYSPTKSSLIMYACCVLHNLCIDYNLDLEEEEPLHPDDIESVPSGSHTSSYDENLMNVAKRIRYAIATQL